MAVSSSHSRTRCSWAARCRRCPASPITSSSASIGLCISCEDKTCIAMCSGQAITLGPRVCPIFEREKCVHCGGCLWNCSKEVDDDLTNIEFRAGSGGLHSAEN